MDAATDLAARLDSAVDGSEYLRPLARARGSLSMYDDASYDYFDLSAVAEPVILTDPAVSVEDNETSRVARDEAGVMHIQNYNNSDDNNNAVENTAGGAKPITL